MPFATKRLGFKAGLISSPLQAWHENKISQKPPLIFQLFFKKEEFIFPFSYGNTLYMVSSYLSDKS